ncbi:MAG: response regulator transcription factor [Acidimicrobiales bacterium]
MRIVIAEDSVLLRAGLTRLLADAGDDVVAAVGDAELLLDAVERHAPDLAIVDVRMPPTFTDEGIRAALRLRAEHAGTAVLVLSQYVEERYATDLLAGNTAGVGYLLKDRVADVGDFVRPAGGSPTAAPLSIPRWCPSCSPGPAPPIRSLALTPRERRGPGPHGRGALELGDRRRPWSSAKAPSRSTSATCSRSSTCPATRPTTAGSSPCSGGWRPSDDRRRPHHGAPTPAGRAAAAAPRTGDRTTSRRHGGGAGWVLVGSVLAVVIVGWGAWSTLSLLGRQVRTEQTVIDEPVEVLEIHAAGPIRVVAGAAERVTITERVERSIVEPRRSQETVDGRLVLRSSCTGISNFCSVGYTVEVSPTPGSCCAPTATRSGSSRSTG